MIRCMIKLVDHTRIVNNDNAMVGAVDKKEDTIMYICTGACLAHFPSGNSIFKKG